MNDLINNDPCKCICTTNPETGLCNGCKRNVYEIRNWNFYSDKMRESILLDLEERMI
mgnify:CR=1 FL=1